MSASRVEATLRRLGKTRKQQRRKDEDLADQIRQAVEEARDIDLPMTKVAKLLDIDRTQLYRTYLRSS